MLLSSDLHWESHPPNKIIPKRDAICRLQFSLLVFFSEEESVVQLDVKYKVFNQTTGAEMVAYRMKSSMSLSTEAIKELLLLK